MEMHCLGQRWAQAEQPTQLSMFSSIFRIKTPDITYWMGFKYYSTAGDLVTTAHVVANTDVKAI
jgi:hypothetical protein